MKPSYFSLPLALDAVITRQDTARCSLYQSVSQHLHLILTTAFGEISNDPQFGCWIWENDFDNLTASNKIREQIKQSLLLSVKQYEQRLQQVKVDILIRQEELHASLQGRRVKKLLDVTISGYLLATREVFTYNDRFFTGPLSY